MSVLKCKMCGGALEVNESATTATCEYCGTEQTIPKVTDDVIGNLFNRANTLRLKSEFDKAEEIYNKIIETDSTQAEAYWGIILSKYGIEYVEDPKTFKRVPTCHRTSFEAITADEDYKLALQYADISQKTIYEAEAKAIDEIQKGILAICQNEKPYDVFICYKETDESGKRTTDSVIANDIYHQLTQEGFKVFYAAITLEDKLGLEYEPYIFAALNSAKVMLVIGSKPEYFTAVWVKNEWSRFMKLMKSDRSKLLIPCYKDMDAYELPEEFAHLQAQDMGKIGFINDVVRGIKKIVAKEEPKAEVKETVVGHQNVNTNIAPLLKRVYMFLEDKEWDVANEYCEKILDIDPECSEAYIGKLLIELGCSSIDDIFDLNFNITNNNNFKKAKRFAENDTIKEIADIEAKYNKNISDTKQRIEEVISIITDNDNEINRLNEEMNSYVVPQSDLVEEFAALEQEKERVEQLHEAKKSLSKDISALQRDIGNVGVFGGAKKKEIAGKIEIVLQQIREIDNTLSNLKNSDEIEADFMSLKKKIKHHQNEQKTLLSHHAGSGFLRLVKIRKNLRMSLKL